MIKFNIPTFVGNEKDYVLQAINSNKICGDGFFSNECQNWFEKKLKCNKALLTPSCTAALEMAAHLIDVKPGDEIIMPSFTFVSTANAFVLCGAKIVFVDINPQTMNIDETKIEEAISSKTKAIVPVHYAGVSCEMDKIMEIAKNYNLYVIEDAAQAMMSDYKGKPLGTIGDIGTFSFHETKNYTSGGEGGLLIINNRNFSHRAEIIREKGTNRSNFLRGQSDKYTWVDIGSSYLPSELQSAYLWGQLQNVDLINSKRLNIWNYYYNGLSYLENKEYLTLAKIPNLLNHNGHIFYLKLKNKNQRDSLIAFMNDYAVTSTFHYIPLHTSEMGKKHSIFYGDDNFTTKESERILRLPIYFSLTKRQQDYVIDVVKKFFGE